MSLLLDALKKAALEKQRREQTNSAKAPAPDALAPATSTSSTIAPAPAEHVSPVAMEVADTETSLSSHDFGELNLNSFDEIRVYPTTAESEPLSLEPAVSYPSVEQQDEGLVFDINEIDQEYLLPPETLDEPVNHAVVIAAVEVVADDKSIVDEFVRKASTLATPVNSSPLTMEQMPDSKVELPPEATPLQELKAELSDSTVPTPTPTQTQTPISAQHSSPVETPNAKPVDVPSTSAPIPLSTPIAAAPDDVETFNVASGKAALAQLLERSKKATGAARKRMVVMYGVLSIIAIVLVLCYYYLLHSSSSLVVAPPSAAPAAEMPVSGEIAEVTPTTDAAAGAAPSTTDGVATPQANLMVEEESSASSPEQTTWVEQNQAEQTNQAEQNSTPQRPMRKQQRQMEEDYSRNDVSLPPERAIKSAMIVEHKAEENAVSEAIARGYKAYQTGDLEGAGAAYREALEQDPYQRDALLGAAAVAVREGRQTDALTLYQKRLARDPKDEYAQAGILALSAGSEQNPQLESELSRLLLEYPEAAHLHFLKGSLYAARQQWAAAQLAFFEAWQRDNKNPDLAFNLAVALDHLDQPKEAARFYRQAIDLGKTRPAGFSVDATLYRLQTLEQQREGATP